jgi:hypothetical protein
MSKDARNDSLLGALRVLGIIEDIIDSPKRRGDTSAKDMNAFATDVPQILSELERGNHFSILQLVLFVSSLSLPTSSRDVS